jgi:hypothetical protein
MQIDTRLSAVSRLQKIYIVYLTNVTPVGNGILNRMKNTEQILNQLLCIKLKAKCRWYDTNRNHVFLNEIF